MARYCNLCHTTFPTWRRYDDHNINIHRFPKPPAPASQKIFHHDLDARICDVAGNYLPPGTPAPPRDNTHNWYPFDSRHQFEFAEWHYEKVQTSEDDLNELLNTLAAEKAAETGNTEARAMYNDAEHMRGTLDSIAHSDGLPFAKYHFRYTGVATPQTPPWKLKTYVVYARNPLHVAEHMAACTDFNGSWDYVPYEEFTSDTCRRFSDFMSARFPFKKAIARDDQNKGAMLTPIILGADKTTVSVATGHQEYHPLYMSLGNLSNDMRRAHRDGVLPIAFLAIPKPQILSPLRPAMTTPHVMCCPDGHYRRAIFQLGPFIADYPEQVCLSGIVSGWCPKCRAFPDELDQGGPPRFRAHTECVVETFPAGVVWDVFGLNVDVEPFTNHFPGADIHELISPDLLHQLIKGTFKDHLVEWVSNYIYQNAESEREADELIAQIDLCLAIAPPFPGLRWFPHGRNFGDAQWTGDDTKALMKIYLSAIAGLVPTKMVRCLAAFLDFCYLARRPEHDTHTLAAMEEALAKFHRLHSVFIETGVRPDGISLPRQHSLVHYVLAIRQFGSPNGLCSSITESKHIEAVKETWRRSNRNDPIEQMTTTLVRLTKLSAARIEFGHRGMLHGDAHTAARLALGDETVVDKQRNKELLYLAALDAQEADGRMPTLRTLVQRYLRNRLDPDAGEHGALPALSTRMKIGLHACGSRGMHHEFIRCNPAWSGDYARYDTVLVTSDPNVWGVRRFRVAQVRQFISSKYAEEFHQCAVVDWFCMDQERDGSTGMSVGRPQLDPVTGDRISSVIPLTSIALACHLMPKLGRTYLPVDFHWSETLTSFRAYYVNSYVDYHAHETIL
ncbi:hypothetical protein OH76DRAFT_1458725 [Lentinus brumalis]|uniref:C2H2-type domain-containing protein n=1 Tax=Lentinus brumalis TaxID=2498619 RepID=A0A371CQG5_9APHY|nr:hypothetical protein OH76DRAFT_1458725 [Polyporus brumalis]